MNYDVGSGPWCSRLADGVDDAEETEQERTTAEALHEIADMPGEDSYGFNVRVVRQGDVCEGQLGWAVGRRNDLLELHFANGWVRFYPDEDVKRQSDD